MTILGAGFLWLVLAHPQRALAGRLTRATSSTSPDPNIVIKRSHQLTFLIWYDISEASILNLKNDELPSAIDENLGSTFANGERVVASTDLTDKLKYRDSLQRCPEDTNECDSVKISLNRSPNNSTIQLAISFHNGLKRESDPSDTPHPRPQEVPEDVCSNVGADTRKQTSCKLYIKRKICDALARHQHGGSTQ